MQRFFLTVVRIRWLSPDYPLHPIHLSGRRIWIFTPVSELPLSAGRKVAVCRDATPKVYEDRFFRGGCWSYFSFGSNSMQANTRLVKLYHLKQAALTWLWNSLLRVDKLGSRQFRLLSNVSQWAPPFVGIKKNSKPRSDPLALLQGPSVCQEPRTKYFGIFAGNRER